MSRRRWDRLRSATSALGGGRYAPPGDVLAHRGGFDGSRSTRRLPLHCLARQSLGAVTKNAGQQVLSTYGLQAKNRIATHSHGGTPGANVAVKKPNSNPSTPPLSTPPIHN